MSDPLILVLMYIAMLAAVAVTHIVSLKYLIRTERTILLTQVFLFVALPLAAAWLLPHAGETYPGVLVTFYGIHACFSLCWLEIWSLSQGGFSLQMLERIDRQGGIDLAAYATKIGQEKLDGRLDGLVAIGLVRSNAAQYSLSPFGRLVAFATTTVANVAGTKIRE